MESSVDEATVMEGTVVEGTIPDNDNDNDDDDDDDDAEVSLGDVPEWREPRVGRYALVEPIGKGSFGSVWAAFDPELDRKVAVKIVYVRRPGDGGTTAGGLAASAAARDSSSSGEPDRVGRRRSTHADGRECSDPRREPRAAPARLARASL